MSNSEAKLHLSLQDGVFEISGSELFVSQQIENFKDIILDALKNNNKNEGKVEPIAAQPVAAEPPVNEGDEEDPSGFNSKSFPRVLHIEDKDVRIIKKMPGSNNAKKSVNTALAFLWGKRSVGVSEIPFQDIRTLCKEQGCLDESNFAAHMKGAREYIIIDGKRGSSAKTCKLTIPGVERAEELLEDLNGE